MNTILLNYTQDCCGAYLIHNFEYEKEYCVPSTGEIDKVRKEVKDKLHLIRNRAIAYIFLNQNQKRWFDKLLKELKFRPVSVGYNNPTKNNITMYVYTNKRPIEGGTNG